MNRIEFINSKYNQLAIFNDWVAKEIDRLFPVSHSSGWWERRFAEFNSNQEVNWNEVEKI